MVRGIEMRSATRAAGSPAFVRAFFVEKIGVTQFNSQKYEIIASSFDKEFSSEAAKLQ
jgi:hypothetical protein